MKLTVKILDIVTRRGILLNRLDARSIGVLDGDRVQIINPKNGVAVTAVVATTTTLEGQGSAGVYRSTNQRLNLTDGEEADIREADRPASLDFIKKKMDGGRLSKDETLTIIKDVVNDDISAAELTAFITASYINPLDMDEVEHLTRAMVETGEQIKFASRPIVDKHSIGGYRATRSPSLWFPSLPQAGSKSPKPAPVLLPGPAGLPISWKFLPGSSSLRTKFRR